MRTIKLHCALPLLCAALAACGTDGRSFSPVAPTDDPPNPVTPLSGHLYRHENAPSGMVAVHVDEAEYHDYSGQPYINIAHVTAHGSNEAFLNASRTSSPDERASLQIRFMLGDAETQYIAGFVDDGPDTSRLALRFDYQSREDEARSITAILRISKYDRDSSTISGVFASRMGTVTQG